MMMRLQALFSGILMLAVVLPALAAAPAPIHVLTLNGSIEPAMAQYIERGISDAEQARAGAVIIKLDTPGGGYEPMRQIVQAMLNSRVPTIVYVSPDGARAASAGVFITMAANVAAMAPVTNIGSAHPVFEGATPSGGSNNPDSTMMRKVVNDSAEYIRSIAKQRGRNADWAEKAVRESANVTAEEAVKLHVVNFIAKDMGELLRKADGMKVETLSGTVTLRTKGAKLEDKPISWYKLFLHYLGEPLVAYFLMLAAISALSSR
jgi:membrane-bound serine protease (ClpP class)